MLLYIAIGSAFFLSVLLLIFLFSPSLHPGIVKRKGRKRVRTDGEKYLDIPLDTVMETEHKDLTVQSLMDKVRSFKERNGLLRDNEYGF